MVDKAELERVADALVAEGEIPSIRTVRERLPRGGSYRNIGLLLADWKADRSFRPRPARGDLPPALLERLADVAAEIWAEGRRQGFIVGENERQRLVARLDALERVFVEVTGRADALAERLARHEPEVQAAVEPAPRRDRQQALRLWAGVMREIEGILAGGNSLTPGEIIRRLSEETLRRVPELRGVANEARLAYKLEKRRGEQQFIKEDGRFALRSKDEPIEQEAGQTVPIPPAPNGEAEVPDVGAATLNPLGQRRSRRNAGQQGARRRDKGSGGA